MIKEKINSGQMFAWMMMFEIGNAIIINIGMEAKQSAWIVILLAMLAGVATYLFIYVPLFRLYPNHSFTKYTQLVFGKYVGWLLSFFYLVYFTYVSGRNLMDFGALTSTISYNETPISILNGIMILALIYGLTRGIEVYVRSVEIFFSLFIVVFIFGVLLLIISRQMEVNNLKPIIDNGWKPIFHAAFPLVYTFPFAEMVTFTMFLPFLNNSQAAAKVGVISILLSGLILSLTTLLNVAVLGVYHTQNAVFPLIETMGEINIGEFLQRLDSLVVIIFVITSFFKVGTFFLAAIIAASDIFQVNNYRKLALPIGIVILLSSILMSSNFVEHLDEGLNVLPRYIQLPIQTGIPLLILLIALFRKHIGRGARQEHDQKE
ncbi:GerAB/ArcD/ProY family transporter [Paenibacillus qinlingensis]|uniref:Spore germination protein KB n=1 Tax=Paenibacillus qinlingensis TaxID=1837343 RepID=A0ABU1P028_9BACL|nr:GerAB/ArcD/ProY family transporter [Paenibacillus qinlingensis]MDR6552914.1 spore germination protein KB [Paenibacillus qinlingensis]